jgi:hypothetical protein
MKVSDRLSKHLIDAYLIDGSLYCYDCAEQIGLPSVERHIRVRKLECGVCSGNPLADTYLQLFDAETKKVKALKNELQLANADKNKWKSQYDSVNSKLNYLKSIIESL